MEQKRLRAEIRNFSGLLPQGISLFDDDVSAKTNVCWALIMQDLRTVYLLYIYTVPSQRHKGYARKLMQAIQSSATINKIVTGYADTVKEGRAFAKACGFKKKGEEMVWEKKEGADEDRKGQAENVVGGSEKIQEPESKG